jgi:hypothetical protein
MFISPNRPHFAGYHEFSGKRDHLRNVLDTLNPQLARSEWAARIRREMTDIMHKTEEDEGLRVDHSVPPIIFKLDGTHIIGITGQDTVDFTQYKEELRKKGTHSAIQGDVFDSFSKEKRLRDGQIFQHIVDDHIVYLNSREAQALSNAEQGGDASLKLPERKTTW